MWISSILNMARNIIKIVCVNLRNVLNKKVASMCSIKNILIRDKENLKLYHFYGI